GRGPRRTPARPASATATQALLEYGGALGLAFQVVDDILDVTQESHVLGKTAGKDQDANKPTYVSVLGIAAARKLAQELRGEAKRALAASGLADVSHLSLLADSVVERVN
ncbi:MAG: polyprenyl synthetase family protein, partial [Rubrivivax sp.]